MRYIGRKEEYEIYRKEGGTGDLYRKRNRRYIYRKEGGIGSIYRKEGVI